ncbi:MAG: hypothetical protein IJZ77_02805 [Bacilli bacterium]|nr:hypothetical protein [Bacilli bacterium]
MKKIYEWALKQTGATKGMINAVNMLANEHAERFIEVVVGCEIKNEDIPKEVTYEGKVYKFVRANYVRDKITYSCEDTSVRYFPDQENADIYANTGDYVYNFSSSTPKDEFPIKGIWTRECEHTTWYTRWFEWANKSI